MALNVGAWFEQYDRQAKKNTGSSVELQIELKAMEKGPSYVYLSELRYRNQELPTYMYTV